MSRLAFLLIFFGAFALHLPAQIETQARMIAKTGEILYKQDLLVQQSANYLYQKDAMKGLHGYVAFYDEGVYTCIYWSGAYENLEVVYTFTSPDPEQGDMMKIHNRRRKLNRIEERFYHVKMQALLHIKGHPDFYKVPAGVRLNIHFAEFGDKLHAYVFSGTSVDSMIPIGNDYLMVFDDRGNVQRHQVLRTAYTTLRMNEVEPERDGTIKTYHSNKEETLRYIQPTDICNLLLYSPWKAVHEHYVISGRFVSIYSLKDKRLQILTQ